MIVESKIEKYYSGSYFSESVAGLLYNLSRQLNQDSYSFLWYWILGCTEMFVDKKIDMKTYESVYVSCKFEKNRFKTKDNNLSKMDNIEGVRDDDYAIKTMRNAKGEIFESRELNVFMLRYWSLYDSCYFSNYFIAKLKTWSDEGGKDLERLFALMGIPLIETKQKYQFMSAKYKIDLVNKFTMVINVKDNKFNMPDIAIDTFAKQIDNNLQFSAIDIVHCANSILEYPSNLSADLFKENAFDHKELATSEQRLYERVVNREENFWAVYHDVLNEDHDYVSKAIEVAMEYQKSIVREVKRIIDGKSLKSCSDFRYCILTNQYFQNNFMSNFLSIHKIASLLIEIYGELSKPKPLAICVQDDVTNKHTVIGVMPSHSSTFTKKNTFGNKFQMAASNSNVRHSIDFFDSSMIEVQKDDFMNFMQSLLSNK